MLGDILEIDSEHEQKVDAKNVNTDFSGKTNPTVHRIFLGSWY